MYDRCFWILKIQFIDPVRKTFYILLEGRTNTEANYITGNIIKAFISEGVLGESLLSEIAKCEFDEWYSVAEKTDTVHIYHSVDGVVTTYFKSIKSDATEKKAMSNNTGSSILSTIEERIKQLKQLELDMDSIKSDIQKHRDAIGELSYKHNELYEDTCHINSRIHQLIKQALITDGFTEEYVHRFLKKHGYKEQ